MINKIHSGKRISGYRKGLHLSQSELSEKLGVTSQAVSKWECGTALPDVELLLELSHLYGVSINELLEDRDIFGKLASKAYEYDGIAYFIPKEETVLAGFKKIDSEVCGTWNTDNDESATADLARSFGVNLQFTSYVRFCIK